MQCHVRPLYWIMGRLLDSGYLSDFTSEDFSIDNLTKVAEIEEAIRNYQLFNGLPADGCCDAETAKHLSAPRCDLKDIGDKQGVTLARWPTLDITWCADETSWNGLALTLAIMEFESAWKKWSQVCAIKPVQVYHANEANVLLKIGATDSLAVSGYPGPGIKQVRVTFSNRVAWSHLPTDPKEIRLETCAVHEFGHVLGIPHLPAPSLMQPKYDSSITEPLKPDIEEAVLRYGEPSFQS